MLSRRNILQATYATLYSVCGGSGLVTNSCLPQQSRGLQSIRLLRPWDFPGKNNWVSCPFFFRGSSWSRHWTQGSNPHLLHCRWILYQLSHQGNPILYVATTKNRENKQVELTLITYAYIFKIRVLLSYNVMLVSAVQRGNSATCIYISPTSWVSFPSPSPSHPSHHRALSWAPCPTQQVPTSSLFYTW